MVQISGMLLSRNRVINIAEINGNTSAATGSVNACWCRASLMRRTWLSGSSSRLSTRARGVIGAWPSLGCRRGKGAEMESAMRADHHHAPIPIPGLLLQKAAGFGIEPQQKTRIGGHLRFQHHPW